MKMHMVSFHFCNLIYALHATKLRQNLIDMRKPLKRDKKRETIRENGENVMVHPEELDSWR